MGADVVMAAALRGEDRVGWDVWGQCWTEWMGSGVRGRSSVRGVRGWYVPVEVVDEEMAVGSGTVVSVRVRLVAVGLDAGRYRGAVAMRRRQWWEVLRIERRCLQQVVVMMVGESERAEEVSVGRELLEDWDERGQAGGEGFGGLGWIRGMRELWCSEQKDERQKAEVMFEEKERDVVFDRG